MNDVLLFHTGHLASALHKTAQDMAKHLHGWDPDDLLNTPVEDVVERLVDMGSVRCPALLTEQAWMPDATEVKQEFTQFGERYTRTVTRLVLVIPYEGERVVFTMRANQGTFTRPQVLELGDNELRLAVDGLSKDSARVRAQFDEQIHAIQQHLTWSRAQIDQHNHQIKDDVPGMVAQRREQLLAVRNMQAEIGYPIHRRADADTYAVPIRRRTVRPTRQPAASHRASFKPEPAMAEQDYQAALRVLRNQRNALERSPSLAAQFKEEEIRDILLIGLNAQFEGDAGGELFNGRGKTDILIRVGDRNIFIGECKVWAGPKTMDEALDQLFSYLVWRDTKAALLLFIRTKNVTAAIDKAITKIEEHPNHKRSSLRHGDDQFEFTMRAQDDPEREIHLALIPFALRTTDTKSAGTG